MKREFRETRIDSDSTRGATLRCESVSPPLDGTKMTSRCAKSAWHEDNHRSLIGQEWD